MVFLKEWEENYNVCPRCDFHDRIGAAKRYEQLFDTAESRSCPPEVREDPLRFRTASAIRPDEGAFHDRQRDPLKCGGDRRAEGGRRGQDSPSWGNPWAWRSVPLSSPASTGRSRTVPPSVTAAGGARMQEGILRLYRSRDRPTPFGLHEAGLPYIVVLTDPTTVA